MRPLLIGGDSFTLGSELKDKSWAELLAINFGYEYKNLSIAGAGNAAIARNIIEELNSDTPAVLIMWTFLARFDFYRENEWQTTTVHDQSPFGMTFMKTVGNNEYYELHNSLTNILLVQTLLEKYKIPYLFTSADTTWDNMYYSKTKWINKLLTEIDWSKWYFINNGQGFYKWGTENYVCGKWGHPLDQAHIDLVKSITPKATELIGFAN